MKRHGGPGFQVVQHIRSSLRSGGSAEAFKLEPNVLMLPGATRSGFARVIAIVLLIGFAGWIFWAILSSCSTLTLS